MIKILFFIENLSEGGAEKVLCNLVNRMDQTKFDITVQTIYPVNYKKYLVDGIHYKSMFSSYSKFNSICHRVEAQLGLSYRLHIKDDYDIEVAYLENGATKVLSSSTNQRAVKLAWIHCDFSNRIVNKTDYVSKTKPWYKKYNKIVCVSKDVEAGFKKLFGSDYDTVTIHNVVDSDEIINKANSAVDDCFGKDIFTIVSVGRLSTEKNYLRLLKCHKALLDNGINCQVVIVGEGPEEDSLKAFIEDNHLQSVYLVGFKSNPYPYIKNADLIASSSNYEGFSTFITEALILGKPIVTTDCSGMYELLGNSEYGLITENSDEAFCEGVKRMLTERGLLAHYTKQAEIRGKDFASENLVKENEDFFVQSLREKND